MKASEYKKLASAKQVVEEVPLPSGAVFKLRAAPIQQWVAVGLLPGSLAAKMQQLAKTTDPQAQSDFVLQNFTEQDFVDSQNLGKRLLEFCAVEPKVIVAEEVAESGNDEAIGVNDILPEDFEAIMKWVWAGGSQGEALANFRDPQG